MDKGNNVAAFKIRQDHEGGKDGYDADTGSETEVDSAVKTVT